MKGASRAGRVLLVSAVLWAVLAWGVATTVYRGDWRGFFMTGSHHSPPEGIPGWPVLRGDGYDGQFFAVLSTDPLLRSPGTPARLDAPAYRAGRIGLPLVAWLLVAGRPGAAAPLAYLALCWGLGLLGIWVAARWLEEEGRSPWGALPLALSAGFVSSGLRATPDAAVSALVLLTLWLDAGGRRSVPVAAFAALARETSLIAAGGVAIARWHRGQRARAAVALAAPLLLVAAWAGFVRSRPGFASSNAGAETWKNFAVPLSWLPAKLAPPWTPDSIAEGVGVVAVLLSIAAGAALLPGWRRFTALGWTYVGFCLLALALGEPVFVDRWAFARVSAVLPLLAVPLATQASGRTASRLLRAVPWAWAIAGVLSLAMSTRFAADLIRSLGR